MKVGIAGMGTMGAAMAVRLLDRGHDVRIWNRTGLKASAVGQRGAAIAGNIDQLVAGRDVVISMLSTPDVSADIGRSIARAIGGTGVYVDASTIAPDDAEQMEATAGASGCRYVHAPVLGGKTQAADGALLVFAGGSAEAVGAIRPVLNDLAATVYTFDRPALAARLKLSCNFMIAGMIATLAQSMRYAENGGLDTRLFLDALSRSALNAPMYQAKGKNIRDGEFTPRFTVELMVKDILLFSRSGGGDGRMAALADVLRGLFESAVEQGDGNKDYSAVYNVFSGD